MSHIYNYLYSLKYALDYGELEYWQESYCADLSCAIDLTNLNTGNDSEYSVKELLEQHGFDRMQNILANTVQLPTNQKVFSKEIREWSESFGSYEENKVLKQGLLIPLEPRSLEQIIESVRKEYQSLGLFDLSAADKDLDTYTNQILILKPHLLSDDYKKPEYQLFLVTGGFGALPHTTGDRVMGHFLADGESMQYRRNDFIGVAKEESVPDWARNNTEKILSPHDQEVISHLESPTM